MVECQLRRMVKPRARADWTAIPEAIQDNAAGSLREWSQDSGVYPPEPGESILGTGLARSRLTVHALEAHSTGKIE